MNGDALLFVSVAPSFPSAKSTTKARLVGPVHEIFRGTQLGYTEGPHLYRRNGYYYLMTAEGGTGLNHAVTIARSRSIVGPYEVDPANPILTSRDDPLNPLQKAGHASIVETPAGETYLAHLCGRPVGRRGACIGPGDLPAKGALDRRRLAAPAGLPLYRYDLRGV